MGNKIKRLIQLTSERRITRFLFRIRNSGYLHEMGWFRSFDQRIPVDNQNQPIPWVTYSFIQFITPLLSPEFSLFEFGSGNSTLFYAKLVGNVTAVEHEKGWYNSLLTRIPNNVELIYQDLEYNGAYCRSAQQRDKQYDLIIIDGRDRVNCLINSIPALSHRGVLVLDDSERAEYKDGVAYVLKEGFRKIDFWGISPGEFYNKSTTVFYRPNNCIGI